MMVPLYRKMVKAIVGPLATAGSKNRGKAANSIRRGPTIKTKRIYQSDKLT